MTIAVDSEHAEFRAVLARALSDMDTRTATRAALDHDKAELPPYWPDAAAQGWLGLHLPEDVGGAGAGLFEAALLMEAVGEHVASGPFLPTVLTSAVLAQHGGSPWLASLADGSRIGATGLGTSSAARLDDGSGAHDGDGVSALRLDAGTLDGDAGVILGAAFADVLLLPVGDDLVLVDRSAADRSPKLDERSTRTAELDERSTRTAEPDRDAPAPLAEGSARPAKVDERSTRTPQLDERSTRTAEPDRDAPAPFAEGSARPAKVDERSTRTAELDELATRTAGSDRDAPAPFAEGSALPAKVDERSTRTAQLDERSTRTAEPGRDAPAPPVERSARAAGPAEGSARAAGSGGGSGSGAGALEITPVSALDRGLGAARVRCRRVPVPEGAVLRGARRTAVRIGRTLAAAQAAGGAAACSAMSTEYAKVRRQFGRTIGSFQAVKHHCADMLVAADTAAAVAWDAARGESDLSAAVAATIALPAFMRCAETTVQVHGGIGFTWDHDAHLYLRRAACLEAVFGPRAADDVHAATAAGVSRELDVPLPPGAERTREQVRAFVVDARGLPDDEQAEALAASGYLMPEWPRPWGIDADTLTQFVVKEEVRSLPRPRIEIPWVPMTVGREGTPGQGERLLPGSLRGTVRWCQLSSEPDAGSDAAAVRTRATRTEGGWLLNGQKVWTSHARRATHGLATVRTDPDRAKHAGLSLMIVDMAAEGITIRPLREIVPGARPTATEFGDTSFNEIFFDDVFVPDENLVGTENDGWRLVRELLGNERKTIGERGSPIEAVALVELVDRRAPGDAGLRREAGHAVAEEQAVKALNLRRLIRAMRALPPTAEANVAKIVNSERIQRMADVGVRALGTDGLDEDEDFGWLYLRSRFTTIGGGTSEIARNVLGERVLGLPRDV